MSRVDGVLRLDDCDPSWACLAVFMSCRGSASLSFGGCSEGFQSPGFPIYSPPKTRSIPTPHQKRLAFSRIRRGGLEPLAGRVPLEAHPAKSRRSVRVGAYQSGRLGDPENFFSVQAHLKGSPVDGSFNHAILLRVDGWPFQSLSSPIVGHVPHVSALAGVQLTCEPLLPVLFALMATVGLSN